MWLKQMKKKVGIRVASFVAVYLMLFGCGGKKEETKKVEVIRPVKTMVVKDAARVMARGFPGKVRAARRAILSFNVSGRIVELPVEEGQQ